VAKAGFIPKNPWEAQFRPGVMAGDGDNETDFFFEFFIPVWGDNEDIVFLNPHLRLDDKNSREVNVGLGYRRLLFNDRLILGANVYYDTMRSRHEFGYQQVGFGLEALSKWLDVRFNYYQPINDKRNRIEELDKYSFGSTALLVRQGWEEALKGFDAEVGVLVPFVSSYVETRAYVGGYWYDSEVRQDIEGRKYRIEVRPCRLVNLQVEVKNDYLRGSDTYLGGYFDIPFSVADLFCCGNPFKSFKKALNFGKGARSVRERMVEKVVRDRHVVVRAYRERRKRHVVDIIYVNQDNEKYGKGTYENPYHDINYVYEDPRYKPGTWIYVFSWDKKADTYYTHFHLLPRMVLWGQGYRVPKFRLGGDGPKPILDGEYEGYDGEYTVLVSGDGYDGPGVVNLADNNEVMGFIIQNGYHGVFGHNIKRTYIHHNIIRWNGGEYYPNTGIYIANKFDSDEVSGKKLRYVIADNEIYGNYGAGIWLSTSVFGDESGTVSDLRINNTILNNRVHDNYGGWWYWSESEPEIFDGSEGSGIVVGNYIGAANIEGACIHNVVSGNLVEGNEGTGIYLSNWLEAFNSNPGSDIVASVSESEIINTVADNVVSGNWGSGVHVENGMMAGVSFYGGYWDGYWVAQDDGYELDGGLTASVFHSRIVNRIRGNTVEGYEYGYDEVPEDGYWWTDGVYVYN